MVTHNKQPVSMNSLEIKNIRFEDSDADVQEAHKEDKKQGKVKFPW